MGWLISIAIILVCLFSNHTITPDIMFIAAALFAIAGSIGLAGSSIASALKKDDKNEKDN